MALSLNGKVLGGNSIRRNIVEAEPSLGTKPSHTSGNNLDFVNFLA